MKVQDAGKLRGLDTETQDGTLVLIATPTRYAEPRSFLKTVEFLEKEPRYICWNADYDNQAILKFLSKSILERLYFHGRVTVTTGKRIFTIHYRRSKYLKVGEVLRKRDGHKCDSLCAKSGHRKTRALFAVYDLRQFYNMSLEKASQSLLSQGKLELPDGWIRQMRARLLDPATRKLVIDYCMIDAKRCEEIAEISTRNFNRIGIDFSRPVSNASLAIQKFRNQVEEIRSPEKINKMARVSYRGGRIECLWLGHFSRAYYYDINSAYPSAMALLTKMDGQWIPIDGAPSDDASYAVIDVELSVPPHVYLGPVPVMPREFPLIYPSGVWAATLDLETYRLVEKLGYIRRVKKGYQMVGGSGALLLPELQAMYKERKANPDNAWAIKICMNALYGKFAQTSKRLKKVHFAGPGVEIVGNDFFFQREKFERYTNFIIAAAITAKIRRTIYEQIPHEDIIFIATDGVMLKRPSIPPEFQGSDMGLWSKEEIVKDLVVVGSGMYTYETRKDGKKHCVNKMRGFDVNIDLKSCLDTPRNVVRLDVRRNVTLAHAVIQKRKKEMNELVEVPRELDLNFDRKRIWARQRSGRLLLTKQIPSYPWRYLGRTTVKR